MSVKEIDGQTIAPDVSFFPNDLLAQIIVDAWVNPDFKAALVGSGEATKEIFRKAGLYIENPVVLTDEDFESGNYVKKNPDEVVFRLPKSPESADLVPTPRSRLLETARIMMAYKVSGI